MGLLGWLRWEFLYGNVILIELGTSGSIEVWREGVCHKYEIRDVLVEKFLGSCPMYPSSL